MLKIMAAFAGIVMLPCYLIPDQIQSGDFDTTSEQIAPQITRFEQALYRGDVETVRNLIASEGVYLSGLQRIFTSSNVSNAVAVTSRGHGVWDETPSPISSIRSIQRLTPDVLVVHACRLQATMASVAVDYVLVKQHGAWSFASRNVSGACSLNH